MSRSDDITPDQGWAWVVCFIAAMGNATTYAINLSFGMLLVELTEYFESSHALTAWINGISESMLQLLVTCLDPTCLPTCFITCSPVSAPAVTYLATRYDFRVVFVAGSLLCVAGHVFSFFTTSMYQLFFSISLVAGSGMGLIFTGSLISVQMWFDRRLGLASGIASAGAGIGSFILAPLIEFFNKYYGWRGTLLLLGGIIGQMAWLGMLMRGTRIREDTQKRKTGKELNDACKQKQHCRVQTVTGSENMSLETKAQECSSDGRTGDSAIQNREKRPRHEAISTESQAEVLENNNIPKDDLSDIQVQKTCRSSCCNCFHTAINFKLFENKQYLVYLVSIIFAYCSYVPFVFLPDKAIRLGIEKQPAALLVSIVAACSMASRIISGAIGDYVKKRRLMLGLVMLVGGIAQFVSLRCESYWSLVLYAVVEGLTNGCIMGLNSLVLKDLLGIELVADAYSLQLFVWGTTPLWKDAFTGWLFDLTNDYQVPFIVIGAFISFARLDDFPRAVYLRAVLFLQ